MDLIEAERGRFRMQPMPGGVQVSDSTCGTAINHETHNYGCLFALYPSSLLIWWRRHLNTVLVRSIFLQFRRVL